MSNASYHHGDLRSALITAGVEALERDGEPTVSLRALAKACGATPAAAYRHFPSKNALLGAIASVGFADLVSRFEVGRCTHGPGTIEHRGLDLNAFGRAYIDFARERPAMFRLMFGGSYTMDDPVGASTRPGARAFELLQASAARAIGKPADDPAVLQRVVQAWSLVHGYATLYLDNRLPEDATPPSFVDALLDANTTGT